MRPLALARARPASAPLRPRACRKQRAGPRQAARACAAPPPPEPPGGAKGSAKGPLFSSAAGSAFSDDFDGGITVAHC